MKSNEKIKFQRPTSLPYYSSSYQEPYDLDILEEEPESSRLSRREKKNCDPILIAPRGRNEFLSLDRTRMNTEFN